MTSVPPPFPAQASPVPGRADSLLAGVELGGTKCVCVLATPDGDIRAQETVATTRPEETLPAIAAVLDRWWAARPFASLGIASFGPVELDPASDRFGWITSTSKPHWRDTDVGVRLARPYPVAMAFDTDVNGAAMAERSWGAAAGLDDFAYVTLGTGVGVGLVVHGRPTRGLGHCELGHIRVARHAADDFAGSCPFHGDCVEGLASGTAIRGRAGDRPLETLTPDDPLWSGVVDAVAQLCHVIVLASGARRIIVGGGVATAQPHLLPRIDARLRESLAGYVAVPPAPYVVPPALGGLAGPLGPIALARSLVGAAA